MTRRTRQCDILLVWGGMAAGLLSGAATAAFAQECPRREYGWTRTIGGRGFDSARAVAVDAQDHVYVCGQFSEKVDFDPTDGKDKRRAKGRIEGREDAFVAQYSPDGEYFGAVTFGAEQTDVAFAMAARSSGIVAGGMFEGQVDFDPCEGKARRQSNGLDDIFVVALHSDLSFDWVWTAGGTGGSDIAWSLCTDQDDNVFVAGTFTNTVQFGNSGGHEQTSNGLRDAFVAKLTPIGELQWIATFGGSNNDYAWSTDTDSLGNIYVAGEFRGTVDFDSTEGEVLRTSNGVEDIFLVKLDPEGRLLWVKTMGGVGGDQGYTVAVSDDDEVYLGGYFAGSVDFDPDGSGDIHDTEGAYFHAFVTRLRANGEYRWTQTFGGTGSAGVTGIAFNGSDGIVLSGAFFETVDFDPGPGVDEHTTIGKRSCFISDWDHSGTYCSTLVFGGAALDTILSLAPTNNGAVHASGNFNSPVVDFDPTRGRDKRRNRGSNDGFIVTLSSGN